MRAQLVMPCRDAMREAPRFVFLSLLVIMAIVTTTRAHETHSTGHAAATYEVTAAVRFSAEQRLLRLRLVDQATGELTAARFTLVVDDQAYVPTALNEHGLRFVSIHQAKRQTFTVTYGRGTGVIEVPLPADAHHATVHVTKGLDYLPAEVSVPLQNHATDVTIGIGRWNDNEQEGWLPADAHLHYERLDPLHDRDWLQMLAGDGLTHAHFMVLRGGNLPEVWAQQYAYGRAGEAHDGERRIHSGEEYRDSSQGHVNLLGISETIPPMSTGGIGQPKVAENFPPLYDVLRKARLGGGLGGPAHGASLARSSTAVLDTVLGATDFLEIANTHLYKSDVWYELMNAGFVLPPAAGTDLPNFPFRDHWQPFLGEVRMYVRLAGERDFAAWKAAVRGGKVYVSSGPWIRLKVVGADPDGTLHLPAEGGDVVLEAELKSPRPLAHFEILSRGRPLDASVTRQTDGPIQHWRIRHKLFVDHSTWFAARGTGQQKSALAAATGIEQTTFAHTAAVRVLVGDQPIASDDALEELSRGLAEQQEYYRTRATYRSNEQRNHFLRLFDRALQEVETRKGD